MDELYTLFAFFVGVPLLIVGWFWAMTVAKGVSTKWFLAMLFLFVFALPAFAMTDWPRIKGPFIVTAIGALLLLGTVPLVV
jgi:phosphoglycerol transferase MdoB-like AlkP superfamily enzyme